MGEMIFAAYFCVFVTRKRNNKLHNRVSKQGLKQLEYRSNIFPYLFVERTWGYELWII